MRRLTRPLLILLALVFLFEAWLWRHLERIVGTVVAFIPLHAVKTWLATAIARLPPGATLLVFVIPFIVLLPLKFLAVWLIVQRQWFGAVMVLILAKLLGLGITAFIFEVTRPKLMQLGWFRWLYEWVLRWLDWAHALVDPIKQRIRKRLYIFAPHRAGRTFKLLWRIRRRMRAQAQ